MMKRFFRSFSCLALVCLLLLSSFAFAAGTPTITVESKTVPLGTESVTLSVSIADNPGLAGMMISLKYDPALRLTKVEKGTALSKLAFTPGGDLSANPFKVLWDALEADGSNGEFLRLTFALPKVAGRYSVTPTMRKGETFDNNMNDVVPVLTPAVITVGDGGAAVPPAPVAPVVPVTPAAPVNPFTDIAKGTYYYDAVLWAYSHEPQVTNGTSADKFSPEMLCTRGQVVTFLWRAQGCPEPKSLDNPFKDVAADAWYFKPVLWAVENGITIGTAADKFSPEQTCSYAHVLTFLHRAVKKPEAKSEADKLWYDEALKWASDGKLIDDTGLVRTPDPMNACPRADIVTYLYRNYKE
ncbi:MAG: S-layer homology domain-containing protein [Oscillospiraceae bacterium]|nr:S-layer homology domain-containing protein [Oscillospiraceae bacterium]